MTAARTPAHDAVLALLARLPEAVDADAELVADLLGIPEAKGRRDSSRSSADAYMKLARKIAADHGFRGTLIEAAGDLVSATGPVQ
jgi:hypothetical protein